MARRFVFLGVLALALGACASSSGSVASACGADAGAPGAACVARVEGTVTDLAGAPVPRASVSFCSRQCYGAAADDAGRFSFAVGAFLRLEDYALHVSGRPDVADLFVKTLPMRGDRVAFASPIVVPRLPASGPAFPPDGSPAAADVTSGDVTLHVPAGTSLDLDIGDVALKERGRELRVAAVPLEQKPEFATTLAGVVALYALAPPSARSSAPLGVRLKNASGLPAGAAVDILVLDDDYTPMPPTAGTTRVAATAHVSSDGATIETDPGQGVTRLTWIVAKKR